LITRKTFFIKEAHGRVARDMIIGVDERVNDRVRIQELEDILRQTIDIQLRRDAQRIRGPATELASLQNQAIRLCLWANFSSQEIERVAMSATRSVNPDAENIDSQIIGTISGIVGGKLAVEYLRKEARELSLKGTTRFIGTSDKLDAEHKTDFLVIDTNDQQGTVGIGLIQVKSFFDTTRKNIVGDAYPDHVRAVQRLLSPQKFGQLSSKERIQEGVKQMAMDEGARRDQIVQKTEDLGLAFARLLTEIESQPRLRREALRSVEELTCRMLLPVIHDSSASKLVPLIETALRIAEWTFDEPVSNKRHLFAEEVARNLMTHMQNSFGRQAQRGHSALYDIPMPELVQREGTRFWSETLVFRAGCYSQRDSIPRKRITPVSA
jgi:hypothetical protein